MSDKALHSPFAKPNSYVGRTLSRAGAKRAVAGRGRYTDDIIAAAHAARRLRAQPARARQDRSASTRREARRQPGVALVMTGAELAKRVHRRRGSARSPAFPA